jgi:hypothetical protein
MEFKICDKVICINDATNHFARGETLVRGHVYTVTEFVYDTDVRLQECRYSWRKERFILDTKLTRLFYDV